MITDPVSGITGRRQGPVLRRITIIAWVLAGLGSLSDVQPFATAGAAAIALVIAVPLLRVCWLVFRFVQERDWRFAWTAIALFGVIAVAGVVALAGR